MAAPERGTTIDLRPSALPKCEIALMKDSFSEVTSVAATRAFIKIRELHGNFQGTPPKEITDGWKPLIDEAAVAGMGEVLQRIPFRTVSVGSEGAKEILVVGEAAPSVQGVFGDSKYPVIEMVSDAVEGTTPASRFKAGASSVVAVVEKPVNGNGIMATPDNIHYLLKFIGPKELNGVIDLERPHKDNLKAAIKALGISPEELTQVTMNPEKKGREANIELVQAAEELGVKVIKIDVGDFMPGVVAATSRTKSPVILVTRGGFEEGIMAAAAARACEGFAQAIPFNSDHVTYKNNPVFTLDELVPAPPDKTLVIASFITPDVTWFDEPGIHEIGNEFEVRTMTISSEGAAFNINNVKA